MSFANKNISSIEDLTFSGFTNLDKHFLGDNNLTVIGKYAFRHLNLIKTAVLKVKLTFV